MCSDMLEPKPLFGGLGSTAILISSLLHSDVVRSRG